MVRIEELFDAVLQCSVLRCELAGGCCGFQTAHPVFARYSSAESQGCSMAHTISTVTVQRGLDPSLLALCAYGGAGPVFDLALEPGDAYVLRTGGGGGYGPPHERPADTVAHDVRQGYVSRELARRLYGVSLVGDTYVVDEDETSRLRAELTNTTDSKD